MRTAGLAAALELRRAAEGRAALEAVHIAAVKLLTAVSHPNPQVSTPYPVETFSWPLLFLFSSYL